jgi:transcriptional regulator with XRE-family HTH domain
MKMQIKYKELGPGLRQLRGDQTLKQLGALLNLTTSHICEMEKGYKMPSINVIDRYARKLDTEINLVLGDS